MRLTLDTTTLRRMAPGDLRALQAYRGDPDIARYQSWEAMDDDRALGLIHHSATAQPLLQPGEWTQIAIAETASDALMGDMGLRLSADGTEGEIGITLAAAYHGKGHAQRAMRLAIGLMFDRAPIGHIRAWADIRNAPSRKLVERCGFRFLGVETTDGLEEAAYILDRPVA